MPRLANLLPDLGGWWNCTNFSWISQTKSCKIVYALNSSHLGKAASSSFPRNFELMEISNPLSKLAPSHVAQQRTIMRILGSIVRSCRCTSHTYRNRFSLGNETIVIRTATVYGNGVSQINSYIINDELMNLWNVNAMMCVYMKRTWIILYFTYVSNTHRRPRAAPNNVHSFALLLLCKMRRIRRSICVRMRNLVKCIFHALLILRAWLTRHS